MIHNKSALRFLFAVVALIATVSAGQTTVKADQGKPGNQGPWPVTCANCAGGDGGVLNGQVAYRPEPQTLVYVPAPYAAESANNAGRVGAHVAVGGMGLGRTDAGFAEYYPLPLGMHALTTAFNQSALSVQYGLRIAGSDNTASAANVIDYLLPIRRNGDTTYTPQTGVSVGGLYYDEFLSDQFSHMLRVGASGSVVMDNQCLHPSNVAIAFDGGVQTLPAAVSPRRFIQVCNDPRNTSTAYWTCSETGTPTTTITDPGDTIFPGDCVTYWVSEFVTVQCTANTANTVIQTKECF